MRAIFRPVVFRLAGILVMAAAALSACLGQASIAPAPDREILPTATYALSASPVPETAVVPAPASTTPAPTPSPTPTPTPAPSLVQLTSGGCCVQPFWSPDGGQVLFVDKPSQDAPSGLWAVDLQGGPAELYTERLGLYSQDMQLLAYPQNGRTIVEHLQDGARWTIPNGGRPVSFSPDGTQIAWTAGQSGPPFDTARRQVWVSGVDGSQARSVLDIYGGGFVDWFADGRMLVDGRLDLKESGEAFWVYDPNASEGEGAIVELARGERLRSSRLSPGGSWLAYQVTFATDAVQNGLWVVNTGSGARTRIDLFGAFRWRDDVRLFIIPLDVSSAWHSLWQYDALSGELTSLTVPDSTPFKIANGDWSVSPNGGQIAFVSAQDFNIWLLTFPQE